MLSPGDVLENRFEIESVVRRSEAFTLFRGTDREKKRAVLVREMPVTARERDKAVKQALAEAQARMKIKHATLPEMYGAYVTDGYFYTVLEDVEGESLKSLTSEGPPDEPQVIRWATDLIRLLDLVGRRSGVTVRDLRPANIVVTDAGELKVMDLGLSRVLRGSAPPPKKQGNTPEVRALGACLYELLTGIPAPELSDRPIAGELFRRVNLVNPDVSEEVADAVERMVDPLSEPFANLEEVRLYLGLAGPIPRREKKERKRPPGGFDPERLDPAEERAALKTLTALALVAGLVLFGLIQFQKWRLERVDNSVVGQGPPLKKQVTFKWTPQSMALKEYLDDLSAFAPYEARALTWHSVIRRKHQVQAATNDQFERTLVKKVIPDYQTFVDQMRVVVTPNDEIRELHAQYVKGARLLLTGFREQRKALHSGNMHDLDDANRFITQGNVFIGEWQTGVRKLERKYGVYDDSGEPEGSPRGSPESM